MMHQIKSGLEKTINLYRTAPLAETLFALNSASAYLNYPENPIVFGMGVLAAAGGLGLTVKQLRIKNRMERSLEEYGYDERLAEKTMKHWCDRQSTKIAMENKGCLEKYLESYEKNKHQIEYGKMPHI